MHEFSIAESIIRTLKKEAIKNNFERVKTVNLKIGILKAVVPEALNEAFKIAGKGTVLENAKLNIKSVPFKIFCVKCNNEIKYSRTSDIATFCRKCGNKDVEIKTGNELIIDSIEGE